MPTAADRVIQQANCTAGSPPYAPLSSENSFAEYWLTSYLVFKNEMAGAVAKDGVRHFYAKAQNTFTGIGFYASNSSDSTAAHR